MTLEAKLTEARVHLRNRRQQEKQRQNVEQCKRDRAALAHWQNLLSSAQEALGDDLMPFFPSEVPADFNGKTDDSMETDAANVCLKIPKLGDLYMAFAYSRDEGKWRPHHLHGRDQCRTVYSVPKYRSDVNEDGKAFVCYTDSYHWHETDDLLEALALAEEEGASRRELETTLAQHENVHRKLANKKPSPPSTTDRLTEALRRFILESIPNP